MKEDYPRNLVELEARFSTEEACREYLLKLRWPEGFVCPRCGTQSAWASKRNLLLCAVFYQFWKTAEGLECRQVYLI